MKETLLPEESRALEEDPGGLVYTQEIPTVPVRSLPEATAIISPVLLIIGAIAILSVITTGLLRSIEADNGEEIIYQPSATAAECQILADKDMNVRMGPGFDYSRAWILQAGQARKVVAKTQDGWLQLINGWLPRDQVTLQSRGTCSSVETALRPLIFDDEITLPTEVQALNWRESLGESFATTANDWLDTTSQRTLAVEEGSLSLAAGMLAYPQKAAGGNHFTDAYYAFQVEWVVIEPGASLVLLFRASDQGAYRIEIRTDGTLALFVQDQQGNSRELMPPVQANLPTTHPFNLVVLNQGEIVTLFVNGASVATLQDTLLDEGAYYLGVQGIGAVVRLNRLEIGAPLPTNF